MSPWAGRIADTVSRCRRSSRYPSTRVAASGSMREGGVNAVIGGWPLSTVLNYQSGLPLTWGDAVFFGKADEVANGPGRPDEWFNTQAGFTRDTATRPASYHYRTWPFRFANVRGPAMNNVDLSVNKKWKLNERGTELQFRGEALSGELSPANSSGAEAELLTLKPSTQHPGAVSVPRPTIRDELRSHRKCW